MFFLWVNGQGWVYVTYVKYVLEGDAVSVCVCLCMCMYVSMNLTRSECGDVVPALDGCSIRGGRCTCVCVFVRR